MNASVSDRPKDMALIHRLFCCACLLLAFAGCSPSPPEDGTKGVGVAHPASRKDQLELEGVINDYCYRQHVKNELRSVRCYANVSQQDIIVYVYAVEDSRQEFIAWERARLSEQLPEHIKAQFLDYPDWSWARAYKITVVDRTQ